MMTVLRCIGAVVAGLAVLMVVVVAVEYVGTIVHPFPEGFDGSNEELCAHVARCPHWVLAAALAAWAAAAFASVWTAGRLGNRWCAMILGVLVLGAVLLNISMLPYPLWFKIGGPVAILAASASAYRLTSRRASSKHRPAGVDG